MKIIETNQKGHIAIILDEEEVKTLINISGIEIKVKETKQPVVKNNDPLLGLHKNNREFIEALYKAYGEGNVIKLNDDIFKNLRKSYFVVNLHHILTNVYKREVIAYDPDNKSFMFMKSPLLSIQSA